MRLLSNKKNKYIQFYGGSRSGKTAAIVEAIIVMCLKYPGSRHLIARYSFTNAKKTIWKQTIYPAILPYIRHGLVSVNKTQGIIDFENGSYIQLGGLQPDQIDSVLGSEFATIYVNEANENPWSTIELLFSRLNDLSEDNEGVRITPRFIADLNPTSYGSWDYKFFHKKLNPETDKRHAEASRIAKIKLNPEDNIDNIGKDYLKTLKSLSPTKRKRFYEGEYGSYEGLIYQLPPKQRSVDFPTGRSYDVNILGLDFGHRHPCAFSTIKTNGSMFVVWDEHYETKMNSTTIIQKTLELYEKYEYDYIYCDGSRPEIIDELVLAGLPAEAAIKGAGSVFAGIMHITGLIESEKLFIRGSECPMHLAEVDSYRWKQTAINNKEVPVKEDDNCMDSMRYAIVTYALKHGGVGSLEELAGVQAQM